MIRIRADSHRQDRPLYNPDRSQAARTRTLDRQDQRETVRDRRSHIGAGSASAKGGRGCQCSGGGKGKFGVGQEGR
jgi:hypothetical protein